MLPLYNPISTAIYTCPLREHGGNAPSPALVRYVRLYPPRTQVPPIRTRHRHISRALKQTVYVRAPTRKIPETDPPFHQSPNSQTSYSGSVATPESPSHSKLQELDKSATAPGPEHMRVSFKLAPPPSSSPCNTIVTHPNSSFTCPASDRSPPNVLRVPRT